MNCTAFEDRLQHAFDEGHSLDAADLADHAANCPACRALWEEFRSLSDAVVLWRSQLPSVDLADEVCRTLQASGTLVTIDHAATDGLRIRPAKTSTVSRSRRSLLAALAGLAALLFLTLMLPTGRDGDYARLIVENKTPLSSEAQVALLVRSAGTAWLSLAHQAAGDLGDAASLVLPVAKLPDATTITTDTEPAPQTWSNGLDTVRPIGESVGSAFRFLWSDANDS